MAIITFKIQGEKVHNVGYRPFLFAAAFRLRIKYFEAINTKSEELGKQDVIVSVSGEHEQLSEFLTFVRENIPENAKVDSISELTPAKDVVSIDEYRKFLDSQQLNKIVQGGLRIENKLDGIDNKLDGLRKDTNENFNRMDENFNGLRKDTNENFNRMDAKYEAISQGMFALIDVIEKRNQAFEKRSEVFEKRLDKTEKNIEALLKILVKKVR